MKHVFLIISLLISILPFFSKVFEKIMANYIKDFIDENNLLYEKQFGFRKAHSYNYYIDREGFQSTRY